LGVFFAVAVDAGVGGSVRRLSSQGRREANEQKKDGKHKAGFHNDIPSESNYERRLNAGLCHSSQASWQS
jgi:hypothetical protein